MKRSVSIQGHQTSISVEDAFWTEFRAISARQNRALASLIAEIDAARPADANLSSAIRLFVLADLRRRLAEAEATSS
ncbi:ribbon-helix-helix domain-containing protein [Aureimonas leprariae]|uniref:Ribbon-helix-helix domain-containing protein n=2 Tax=Plantimonas leprariae TaxID=2615207 RepID=A0A7V7PS55_9HYPH|nr:ribbon-helix-helix domain-containing protein [Aureimonas leprariae]